LQDFSKSTVIAVNILVEQSFLDFVQFQYPAHVFDLLILSLGITRHPVVANPYKAGSAGFDKSLLVPELE